MRVSIRLDPGGGFAAYRSKARNKNNDRDPERRENQVPFAEFPLTKSLHGHVKGDILWWTVHASIEANFGIVQN